MKLIPPRERHTLLEQEKERVAREEKVISDRVEALREIEQKERQNLDNFRNKEFLKFREDKTKREEELQNLDSAIATKKKEVEAYYGPLDKQWALFKRVEKHKIEVEESEQVAMRATLVAHEQRLAVRDKKLSERELSLKGERLKAIALLDEARKAKEQGVLEASNLRHGAADLYNEAERAKVSAQKIEDEAKTKRHLVEQRLKVLDEREKDLEDRETAVLIKELQYYSPIKTNNGISNPKRVGIA